MTTGGAWGGVLCSIAPLLEEIEPNPGVLREACFRQSPSTDHPYDHVGSGKQPQPSAGGVSGGWDLFNAAKNFVSNVVSVGCNVVAGVVGGGGNVEPIALFRILA